jgi:hypothetical protein
LKKEGSEQGKVLANLENGEEMQKTQMNHRKDGDWWNL